MWRRLSGIILRYRFILLSALAVATGFMAWRAVHVQLSYERVQILPVDDSDYIAYKNFKKTFGEDGSVMTIGFSSDSLFRLKQFNEWYDLGDSIKHIDGIQEVVSVARSYYLLRNDSLRKLELKPLFSHKPQTQQEMDSLHEVFNRLPFYQGLLVAPHPPEGGHAMNEDSNLNSKRSPSFGGVGEASSIAYPPSGGGGLL